MARWLALVSLLVASMPLAVNAGELQVDAGLAARKSTWRGDAGGGPHLGGGYRFASTGATEG